MGVVVVCVLMCLRQMLVFVIRFVCFFFVSGWWIEVGMLVMRELGGILVLFSMMVLLVMRYLELIMVLLRMMEFMLISVLLLIVQLWMMVLCLIDIFVLMMMGWFVLMWRDMLFCMFELGLIMIEVEFLWSIVLYQMLDFVVSEMFLMICVLFVMNVVLLIVGMWLGRVRMEVLEVICMR